MRYLLLIPLVAASLPAQETLTRDGAFWVHTVAGESAVAPGTRLQVFSRGKIILRGGTGSHVSFRLTQRVKARTEEDARQLFGTVTAAARSLPGMTRLVISPHSAANVTNELEVTAPQRIAVAYLMTQVGGIEAYDFDGAVEAQTPAGEIRADRIRGFLTGRTGGGEIRLGKIGGAVHCVSGGGSIYLDSAGGETNCETAGGEIVVKQAGGPVELSTQGGNISVVHAAGSVEAHSAAGMIDVRQAGGAVIADTRGGSIQVGSARGVRAEAVQGAVRVRGASGPVRVSTAAGNILAQLMAGVPLEDSSLVAGSGDITVLIPSGLALSVMATNDTGGTPRIISDFPDVQVRSFGFPRPPVTAQGRINGGGPVLNINAGSGVIYLRRKQ
jgi:hypothetical protein